MAKANEHTKLVERHQQTPGPTLKVETCPVHHEKGERHLPLWGWLGLGSQGSQNCPSQLLQCSVRPLGFRISARPSLMPCVAGADGGHLCLCSAWLWPWDLLGHLQRSPGTVQRGDVGTQRAAITFRHLNHQPGLSFHNGLACKGSPRAASHSHHRDLPTAALLFSRRLRESLRKAPLLLSPPTPSPQLAFCLT